MQLHSNRRIQAGCSILLGIMLGVGNWQLGAYPFLALVDSVALLILLFVINATTLLRWILGARFMGTQPAVDQPGLIEYWVFEQPLEASWQLRAFGGSRWVLMSSHSWAQGVILPEAEGVTLSMLSTARFTLGLLWSHLLSGADVDLLVQQPGCLPLELLSGSALHVLVRLSLCWSLIGIWRPHTEGLRSLSATRFRASSSVLWKALAPRKLRRMLPPISSLFLWPMRLRRSRP